MIGGRFQRVTVTADDLRIGGMALTGLAVAATDIRRPGGDRPGTIGTLSAQVTVPFSALPATEGGRSLRYGATSDGRLAITTSTSRLPIPVTVIATTLLHDGRLSITPQDIRVLGVRRSIDDLEGLLKGGRAGAELRRGADRQLPALPPGLSYTSVTPTTAGLTIRMAGHDLSGPLPAEDCAKPIRPGGSMTRSAR